MMGISGDLDAGSMITMLLFIHLTVGIIRGLYRYHMIEKYHYNYYGDPPMNFLRKLAHNGLNRVFSTTTLLISALLAIMAFLFFNVLMNGLTTKGSNHGIQLLLGTKCYL
ncbi:hypothetical protein ACEZ3G_13300 [Maribacter algicola]|uniref:Uncharacterized protein n=1 Tax=Meishania litoralis TaxID=3434685 RepID=A0ACC7LLM8_9FLAO